MKKMKFTAVLVLMLSATSAFADSTCADISGAIATSKTNIAQATENIKQLDELIPQIQTQIMINQMNAKDDSLILGNGQDRLREDSFQAVKARAFYQASIRSEEGKIEIKKAEHAEKCSSYEKFE